MRMSGKSLRTAGLFAGIAGLELGLERAGHRAVALCEVDPAAREVLKERFPNVRLSSDVRRMSRLPSTIDLLTAGFPCQDLSQAGKTAGLGGGRSRLVHEVFRLLRQRPVPWVLLENVSFLLHVRKGRALRTVLGSLEDLGYRWAYRVIDSRAFGLPQRRERVFILAALEGDPRAVLLSDDAGPAKRTPDERRVACGFYWTEGNKGVGWAIDGIPTLKGGSALGIPSAPAIVFPDGRLITPDIRDAERLQGFPIDWTKPAEQVKGRHRWRLVGNAVTVDVAAWLGRRLREPGTYDASDDEPLRAGPWPRAAWNLGEGAFAAEVSAWPERHRASLASFLQFDGQPLSAKAAAGFYTRLCASTLRASDHLKSALRAHLEGGREDSRCRKTAA